MSDIDFRQNGKRISGSNGSSGYEKLSIKKEIIDIIVQMMGKFIILIMVISLL